VTELSAHVSTLELVPIDLAEARLFVRQVHRHNDPTVSWKFGVGVAVDGDLVGVAVVGRVVARKLAAAEPRTVEILRVAVRDGAPRNACSKLYGACCRAAAALGYTDAVTYTLEEEDGASVKAAGFRLDRAGAGGQAGWSMPTRPRYEENLFGERRTPAGLKNRWRRSLTKEAAP
jgi:hypothetical protein